MLSEKQLLANIENAKKSTGPTSQAGKDRSRLNAYVHGLSLQTRIMPEEEMKLFNQFSEGITAEFNPATLNEQQLAQSYASFQWRINRCAAIEENMFTLGLMAEVAENLQLEHPQAHTAASYAKTFREEAKEFDRLSMYNQRLLAGAAKVLKELQQLQAERRKREESDMCDAANIYENYKRAGGTFDPQAKWVRSDNRRNRGPPPPPKPQKSQICRRGGQKGSRQHRLYVCIFAPNQGEQKENQ